MCEIDLDSLLCAFALARSYEHHVILTVSDVLGVWNLKSSVDCVRRIRRHFADPDCLACELLAILDEGSCHAGHVCRCRNSDNECHVLTEYCTLSNSAVEDLEFCGLRSLFA